VATYSELEVTELLRQAEEAGLQGMTAVEGDSEPAPLSRESKRGALTGVGPGAHILPAWCESG